ncbi:MAG: endonuclease domain-containing protein [Patescibacteria group bacterium]|jgi:very-short-patch-repair endonuclease
MQGGDNRVIIKYDPKLKQLAGNLRKNSTLSEVLLWRYLKGRKIQGYRFHRQKPIGNYIVDFFCPDLLLAIEIDGLTHGDKLKEDEIRQKELEKIGISFLRFTDSNVKNNCWAVVEEIKDWVILHASHTPA